MSDNEIDAELLALVGDDSSSDEEAPASRNKSPSAEASRSVEKTKSPARRGLAQKPRARKNARKSRQDDSDEDGEASASPSPTRSLGSAAMEESQSDTSPGDLEDDAPLYPIEGKFSSEKDRQTIMGMTEIQREEILAERAAEVMKKAQDQQLKLLLKARQGDDAATKKRKAGAADLDDGQRKSSRKLVKASEPLEAYKRQRELKGAQRARDADRRKDKRSPSEEAGLSDRDADGESEVEWDDRKAPASKEEAAPEIRDFERIRIGRTNFASVLHYPTFEQLINGCYCRVSIARDSHSQSYRVAQIKGFKEGRPYFMDGPNGRKVYTDRYLILGHGKSEKEYPLNATSDSRFTDQEFDSFKDLLKSENIRFPSRGHVMQKLDDIHALLDHKWTEEDVQFKVNNANAMRNKFENYGRDRIVRRRDEAATRGDESSVARFNADLTAYDVGQNRSGGQTVKPATPNKAIAQQERLAQLNKANRAANEEEIRKVQLAEKRAQQKLRDEAIARARKREAEAAEAAEAAKNKLLQIPGGDDDLFGGSGTDISRAGTPANGGSTPKKDRSRAGTPMASKDRKPFALRNKNMEDEALASMDLGIEIDI